MPQLDSPLLLAPVFKPKIWGRADLAPLFAHPDAPEVPRRRRSRAPGTPSIPSPVTHDLSLIGEVWLTDDTSRFLNGPVAEMTLGEACEKYESELLGGDWSEPRFPILAKYLFTNDWLSVQVHPNDDYAARHESRSPGKCEMWYVVSAERKASYLLGSKPGVTMDRLKKSSEHGKSKELLNHFHPQAGEAIYLPPGMVHALGPGLVVFEAEQNSDLTYRLDDFGRVGLDGKPRPLQWDKAREVIRLDVPPRRDLPLVRLKEAFGSRRYVLASRKFAVEELLVRRAASFTGSPRRVETLAIVHGQGRVETPAGWLGYRTGQTWLIPPAARQYRLVPREPTRLFRVYVPNIESDFRRPLEKRRVRAAMVNGICFD
ncbi:MAG TPA: type I phosphomannose isomerase catalytic subunit [Terriglobia bacterium]|nr:type I phosphomannose isomerase catalytic subunit [Terriglobia bacterium]